MAIVRVQCTNYPWTSASGFRKPRRHLTVIDKSGLLSYHASVFHDHKIGYAHDIESLGNGRPSLGIDFQHDRAPCHLFCCSFDFRRCHATRPAPLGPKIDEYGDTRAGDDFIESRRVSVNGFGDRRKRRFA